MADQENNSVNRPFHQEGDAYVFDTRPDPQEAARQRREDEQHEFARAQVKTNQTLARFTGALVVATFCTIGVGIWQGCISQQAAKAAGDAVAVARDTLTETQKSNAQQRLDSVAAAKDAKVIADKNAAQSDKALQATIDNFHQEQRAWIGVCGSQLMAFESGKPIRIVFKFCNTGKTPAHKIRVGVSYFIDPEILDGPSKKDLKGLYFGNSPDVAPNSPLIVSSGKDETGSVRSSISQKQGDATLNSYFPEIYNRTAIVTWFGEIHYVDEFGHARTTQFCTFIANPATKELNSCRKYNEMN